MRLFSHKMYVTDPMKIMFDFWHKDTTVGILLVIMNIRTTVLQIATLHHSQALYSGVCYT